MKAVILAAGRGTRLAPLTDIKPKCLVTSSGRPIIDFQIRALIEAGVSEIIVLAGYRAEMIRKFISGIPDPKPGILINQEWDRTNNMYSLYLARNRLAGEPFILANGDVIVAPEVISGLVADPRDDLIVSQPGAWNEESMKAVVASDGSICDISKTIPPEQAHGLTCDIYKFSAAAGDALIREAEKVIESENNRNEWTELALQRLMQSGKIAMEPFEIRQEQWLEIDTLDDLARADTLFSPLSPELPGIKAVFCDLDGTLYLGDSPIPGASDFIGRLRDRGTKVFFMSNNSSRGKAGYIDKLKTMGIPAREPDILLSTDGLIDHLKKTGAAETWTIGTEAMKTLLRENGIATDSSEPDYVVLGYDTELTYPKIRQGALFLIRGVPLLATHPDMVCPTPDGPVPDIGSMMALLKAATGAEPAKVFGKPNPEMLSPTLCRLGITPQEAVVVGDRLYTDMALARNAGCRAVLVLSGETTRSRAENLPCPALIVASVAELA
ncbi:MAG TPA: HAD-IIA family hydrolase [bacterium]|nr:HAD-IIA family hydrolase [bacterium]HPJ71131.1 HAD-IIA family hydrolase [bacterium]HPQ65415.1 HAD-IIA family hydrolase [bacterium]